VNLKICPPPAPRLPLDADRLNLDKLHPRRVSPSYIFSPRNDGPPNRSLDHFASPIPTKPAANLSLTGVATEQISDAIAQYLAPPFLISPRTPSGDSYWKQNFLSPRVAPSLPALVEVACAAHAHCNWGTFYYEIMMVFWHHQMIVWLGLSFEQKHVVRRHLTSSSHLKQLHIP